MVGLTDSGETFVLDRGNITVGEVGGSWDEAIWKMDASVYSGV